MSRLALPTRLTPERESAPEKNFQAKQPAEAEDLIRYAGRSLGIALDPQQPVEHQREDDHGQERLQDGPDDPEHGLFVADEDIAPGEEVEQLAVRPQFAQVKSSPTALVLVDHEAITRRCGGGTAVHEPVTGLSSASRNEDSGDSAACWHMLPKIINDETIAPVRPPHVVHPVSDTL